MDGSADAQIIHDVQHFLEWRQGPIWFGIVLIWHKTKNCDYLKHVLIKNQYKFYLSPAKRHSKY